MNKNMKDGESRSEGACILVNHCVYPIGLGLRIQRMVQCPQSKKRACMSPVSLLGVRLREVLGASRVSRRHARETVNCSLLLKRGYKRCPYKLFWTKIQGPLMNKVTRRIG